MYRSRPLLFHGLRRHVARAPWSVGRPLCPNGPGTRSIVTDADVEKAREYCQRQVQQSDYDAHLLQRFVPRGAQDAYLALRALNLELVRLPEVVSNPTIGYMRMQFWRESLDKSFAGTPPAEPICLLLHRAVEGLRERASAAAGDGRASASGTRSAQSAVSSMRFWVQRVVKTREKHMDNRPFVSLAALEDYAENTYSTLMYATLAALPMQSMHVDHLASHIGKAAGIVAVLRGVPVLAAPRQPAVRAPGGSGAEVARAREPVLLLPLDVMAESSVREEDVFRQGPAAQGFQDAVFTVATRANDHLITTREMLKNIKAGRDPGHEFEHKGEDGHVYDRGGAEESDVERDIRRGFGVLLESVPAQEYLSNLESCNFDPFAVRASWKLPWRIWQALRKNQI